MVTDAEAWGVLPPSGFLRHYVEYAYTVCDGPSVYALGAALATLATVVDPDLVIPYGANGIPPHVYALCVGSAGSRKTTIGAIGPRILAEVDPDRRGFSKHESEASLLEAIATQRQQLIFHGEFGSYLAGTGSKSYKSTLRESYMELFDGDSFQKAAKGTGVIEVDRPRLSLLCCVAPGLLEKHTEETDWTGGFFSRFFVFAGKRERRLGVPPEWPEMERYLVELLTYRRRTPVGPLLGFAPDAKAMLDAWDEQCDLITRASQQRWTEGVYSRLTTLAVKAALIYSLDAGRGANSGGRPWYIGVPETTMAIRLVGLHLKSVISILDTLAMGPYAKVRRAVLDAMGPDPRPFSRILRETSPKVSHKTLKETLESLQKEGMAFKWTLAGFGAEELWAVEAQPAEQPVQGGVTTAYVPPPVTGGWDGFE